MTNPITFTGIFDIRKRPGAYYYIGMNVLVEGVSMLYRFSAVIILEKTSKLQANASWVYLY